MANNEQDAPECATSLRRSYAKAQRNRSLIEIQLPENKTQQQ